MDDMDREERDCRHRMIIGRHFRDRTVPWEELSEAEFKKRYRFTKRGFFAVLAEFAADFEKDARVTTLSPAQRFAVTLASLANNSFQIVSGDNAGCSQRTVSNCVQEVCQAIAKRAAEYIEWPEGETAAKSAQRFKALTGIPGIVAAVDGTHCKIVAPHEDEHAFVNRKGTHSLNVGAACQADLKFVWFSARFPGSAHDSRVFRESELREDLESGRKKGILLGDSAYRAEKYLLKPFNGVVTGAEERYNKSVCRGRVLIENAFGVLKRQFACLHGVLRTSPNRAAQRIATCMVLRNCFIDLKERDFDDEEMPGRNDNKDGDDDDDDDGGGSATNAISLSGDAFRRQIVAQWFSRP